MDDFLGSVAFKLSTVFTTIGEIPLIRYDKSSSAAKKLGRSLKERMEELEGQGLELSKKIDAPADEVCLLGGEEREGGLWRKGREEMFLVFGF